MLTRCVALTHEGYSLTKRSFQSKTSLKGWECMQETLLSHDEDMISDFVDDIDTLLVFVSR